MPNQETELGADLPLHLRWRPTELKQSAKRRPRGPRKNRDGGRQDLEVNFRRPGNPTDTVHSHDSGPTPERRLGTAGKHMRKTAASRDQLKMGIISRAERGEEYMDNAGGNTAMETT